MKTSSIFLPVIFMFFTLPAIAQFSMTFTSGMSPQQTPDVPYIFVNRSSPKNEFTFDLAQIKASYFVGVGVKYMVDPFFFMAEAQYNKREYIYDVAYTFPGFGRTEEAVQYTEYMNVINLPLSLGVDLGVVDVYSGFLPQLIASHHSDLASIKGYSEDLGFIRFGWHTGVAASISQLRLGINYQMDFNNYADHAYIYDQHLALSGRSSRLLGTLSYHF